MFRVLFLMLALLAGLIAGPYLSGQQGYGMDRHTFFTFKSRFL